MKAIKRITLVVLLALSLSTGEVQARQSEGSQGAQTLQSYMTQALLTYIGAMPGEHPQKKVDIREHYQGKPPKVKALGFETSLYSTDGWWGLEVGLNFDIGVNWELPLYNQDQYLVSRIRASAFVGGRQYVTFQLWYFKIHIFFDVWGVRCTFFDNYMRVDIVNYGDFCAAAKWFLDITRFQLYTQIDINECLFGLVGQFTNDTQDCDWSTYYINHPLLDFDVWEKQRSGDIYANTCGYVPPYDN